MHTFALGGYNDAKKRNSDIVIDVTSKLTVLLTKSLSLYAHNADVMETPSATSKTNLVHCEVIERRWAKMQIGPNATHVQLFSFVPTELDFQPQVGHKQLSLSLHTNIASDTSIPYAPPIFTLCMIVRVERPTQKHYEHLELCTWNK